MMKLFGGWMGIHALNVFIVAFFIVNGERTRQLSLDLLFRPWFGSMCGACMCSAVVTTPTVSVGE
jgi:hypothetical protein